MSYYRCENPSSGIDAVVIDYLELALAAGWKLKSYDDDDALRKKDSCTVMLLLHPSPGQVPPVPQNQIAGCL